MQENKQRRQNQYQQQLLHHHHCSHHNPPHNQSQQQPQQQQQSGGSSADLAEAVSAGVRKKCPTSTSSCCKRTAGGPPVLLSSGPADSFRSDIRPTGGAPALFAVKATPNKAQTQGKGKEAATTGGPQEVVALRRRASQTSENATSGTAAPAAVAVQSRPSSAYVKFRSQSASSSPGAASAAADADPFSYQDCYPYSCEQSNSNRGNNSKRMSASNSRRSSRIKLPSTRAESRDEGNYFYPADSLKLYGHAGCEFDDESDSGASSLPSSNGSTLNSSCASIDLVRCKTPLDAPSTSPQHRRTSLSSEDQQQQQQQNPPPQSQQQQQQQQQQPQQLHHQQHQQVHLAEFSKFKNDSGTFTDADLSPELCGCPPDQDLTPTKHSAIDSDGYAVSEASINSRSTTLGSCVTVIERRHSKDPSATGDSQQQHGHSRQLHHPQTLQLRDSSDRSSSSTLEGSDEGDDLSSPRATDDDEDEQQRSSPTMGAAGAAADEDAMSQTSDLTSVSDSFSLMQSDLKYEFNTWDGPTIRTFGLRVREIDRPPSESVIAAWSDAELRTRLRQLGRLRGSCPRLSQPGSRQFSGRVRVHVNLIRPIRLGRAELPQLVPRGQSRLLQLTSSVGSLDVVQALLAALQVKEQAYKFALYEHSIDGDKSVTFRKLHPTESPLAVTLAWLHDSPLEDLDECRTIFERKKVVLQENESGLINWSAFSVPELANFLQILRREENEYRESIQLKYLLMKREMRRRIRQLEKQKLAVEEDWP